MSARHLALAGAALSVLLLSDAGNAAEQQPTSVVVLNDTSAAISFRVQVSRDPRDVTTFAPLPAGNDMTIELKGGEGVLFLRTKGAAEVARRVRAGERYVIRFDRSARRYDLSRVLRP